MKTKSIPLSKFKHDLRDAVLQALDDFIFDATDTIFARGWEDKDLPGIFVGLDAHAEVLANRINARNDGVQINMED